MRWCEIINEDNGEVITPNQYPVQRKYDEFNRTLFGGQLPKIPIDFTSLKNVSGQVLYSIVRPNDNRPSYMKYDGAVIKDGTLRMQLSSVYKRSIQEFDGILIHEMIHVLFAIQGNYGDNHGADFQRMAAELTRKVGFVIPITDTVDHLELASDVVKPVGVILVEKNDSTYQIAVLTPNVVSNNTAAIGERLNYFITYGYFKNAFVFVVATATWSRLALKYPVQRKFDSNTKYYSFNDQSAIADITENGKLLLKVHI